MLKAEVRRQVKRCLGDSSNVAKPLDYFEVQENFYLVEEFVDGADLAKVMGAGLPYLPPSTCARLLHQLAKGLSASHHAGVVHRDLKPSNVMIVGGHRFLEEKITDFGIAKMAEGEIGAWAEGEYKGCLIYSFDGAYDHTHRSDTSTDGIMITQNINKHQHWNVLCSLA